MSFESTIKKYWYHAGRWHLAECTFVLTDEGLCHCPSSRKIIADIRRAHNTEPSCGAATPDAIPKPNKANREEYLRYGGYEDVPKSEPDGLDRADYEPFVSNRLLSVAITEWIAQGRSQEAIHGVLNFFSGRGLKYIEEQSRKAVVAALEELKKHPCVLNYDDSVAHECIDHAIERLYDKS